MKVTFWGTRGSLPSPGPETARYGGNTSCVQVVGSDGTLLVLDAGTGIRRLGMNLHSSMREIHILLTHLHLDHIQGLGFFRPLDDPECQVHIWGPGSITRNLRARLSRYLSPPLFPIHLRDLPSKLVLHDVGSTEFVIGEFAITSAMVCHPGPTLGYRIASHAAVVTYLPDHEPALGVRHFPESAEWTSGYALAADADLLIHDAQYGDQEYAARVGWGHSSLQQAVEFGRLAQVKQLVPFHHDPAHRDQDLDRMTAGAVTALRPGFAVIPAKEGDSFEVVARAQK
jgi:phosphoribosyl 1,2-cyclic phosphodiesterase